MTSVDGTEIRKPVRARSKEQFKADLIEAARRLFLERGVHATSMADLGRELGVSKPTVYEAFESKRALIEAVFSSAASDVDNSWVLNALAAPVPFPEFLDLVAQCYKSLFRNPRQVELFMLVFKEGSHSNEMLQIYVDQFAAPTISARRKIVALAIERGECVELPIEVVQRLLIAPFHYLLLDLALYGPNSMKQHDINLFIDHSFAALKTQLCGFPAQTRFASEPDADDKVEAA